MILMMGPVIYGEGFLFARVQIVAVASLHSIVKFMFGDDNAGSCVFCLQYTIHCDWCFSSTKLNDPIIQNG